MKIKFIFFKFNYYLNYMYIIVKLYKLKLKIYNNIS